MGLFLQPRSPHGAPNVTTGHRCYVHDACNVMFRRIASLSLRFALYIMTQQNPTFWGLRTPAGAITPTFEFGRDIYTMHLPQVSSSYVYSFRSYHVNKQTNKQTHIPTNKQTPVKTSNVLHNAMTLRYKTYYMPYVANVIDRHGDMVNRWRWFH